MKTKWEKSEKRGEEKSLKPEKSGERGVRLVLCPLKHASNTLPFSHKLNTGWRSARQGEKPTQRSWPQKESATHLRESELTVDGRSDTR